MTTGLTPYNTNANSNTGSVPTFASEGILAKDVNNVIRDMQARLRQHVEAGGWFDWGHTATYIDTKTFSVPGDVTTIYTTDRRLKISLSGKEVYANVNNSSIDGNTTKITLTEPVINNTIAKIYIGFETKIISHYVGNQDLCFVTTTNNGNTLKLQPVLGILANPLYNGTELRFYADTNNTGNVTLNGKPLKYESVGRRVDLGKDFIKSGREYRVKWDKASDQWVVTKGLIIDDSLKGTSFIVSLDKGKFFTRKSDGSLPTGVDSTKVWSLADQKTNPAQPTTKTFIELPKGTVKFEDFRGDSSSTARPLRGNVSFIFFWDNKRYTRDGAADKPEEAFIPSKKGSHGTIKDSGGTDLLLDAGAMVRRTDKATSWHPTFNIESKTISVVLTEDKVLDYTLGKPATADSKAIDYTYRHTYSGAVSGTDLHHATVTQSNEPGKFDGYIVVSYD